jgi:cysteine synthase A
MKPNPPQANSENLNMKPSAKFTAFSQVGNTPIVKLGQLSPASGGNIWLKIESGNPTGSYKDRMAIALIGNALIRGDLRPEQTVVEYTGGSTGSALAFACAAYGINFTAIFSDAFSLIKQKTMEAFGAQVLVEPSHGKGITPELIHRMKQRAYAYVEEVGGYYADQFGSPDIVPSYEPLGMEICHDMDDDIDVFCTSIGTGGAIMGVLSGMKKSGQSPKVIGLEPLQSPILTTGTGGSHRIEGIGVGFYPPFLNMDQVDHVRTVDQDEAFAMCRLLASKHGIFCGPSTGLNVAGAIALAKDMIPGQNIVTLGVDSGLKYLSGSAYSR